jgi:hypothetical protein
MRVSRRRSDSDSLLAAVNLMLAIYLADFVPTSENGLANE